jgi:metal-responsive CopG/Arc/MetJ family transcriptional regulator
MGYQSLVVVTFKADPDMLQLLDRYAIKYRISRSEAIRKAIVEMIESESGEVRKARVVSGGRL